MDSKQIDEWATDALWRFLTTVCVRIQRVRLRLERQS